MNRTLLIVLALLAMHLFSEAQEISMPACEPVWKYALTGSQIGLNTLQCYDYDGDGLLELVAGTHTGTDYQCSYWYKLEYDPATMKFNQVWVSPFYQYEGDGPTVIESFDADNDGLNEIIVGYSNSRVDVIDAVTMLPEASFKIPSWDDEAIFRIIKADADNDGEDEIVCCTTNATYLMHLVSYTSDFKIWYGAKDMRCGNVDSVPGNELVYGNGSVVSISNGQAQLLWDFTTTADTYRKTIKLFDLNEDDIMEIFYLNEDLFIYDASLKQEKFRISHGYNQITEVLVADTYMGNGKEIILGRDNGIDFYNTEGVLDRQYINHYQSGAYGMSINKTEINGDNQLIFASGGGSTASDMINIYDLQTNEVLKSSTVLDSPLWGLKVVDVNNDNKNELVFANGEYSTTLTYLNPTDKKIMWQEKLTGESYDDIVAFDIADFDNDGDKEIVHITEYWNTIVTVMNARTHETEWVNSFPESEEYRMNNIMIKDADQDGVQEFIMCSEDYLYFVNPEDFSIEWSSPVEWTSEYYSSGGSFQIANTDTDPNMELLWLTGSRILVIDCFTKQLELTVENIRTFTLYDIEKDGISEIFYCGFLQFQGSELGLIGPNGEKNVLSNQYYSMIAVVDIPGRTKPVLALFSHGNLYFMTIDGKVITEPLSLTNHTYGYERGHIKVTDYDKNGVNEIFVVTNETINEIDITCYLPLMMDEQSITPCQGLEFYPNPANETIYFKKSLSADAIVYNSQGMQVMNINSGQRSADISNLSSGLYFVRMPSDDQESLTRFIKQ